MWRGRGKQETEDQKKENKTTGKRRLVMGFGREISQIRPRRVSCLVFLA